MPASGGDPVASALRVGFAANGKMNDVDHSIETSAKRVLLSRIEYGPPTNYQSTVLNSLKSKYVVINTKVNNGSVGVNGLVKKPGVNLPVPRITLFAPEKVQLGFRGSLSVGSGMVNLGNTCYLNSTLQALFHVPAFVNWLLNDQIHLKCEQNADFQVHPDDITCAVIKTFKCSQQKTGSAMKPICIYSKLKAICKHLSQGSQEDAHEFMRYLLESLEKHFLTKVQGHNLPSSSKETTPINQIFGGYIRTEVTCLNCRAVSTTFQHFQDLPLDIRRASTLDDALAGYFERERLDGDDAYKCDKCSRKVPATKKFSVERPPNVLSVQLKRFSMMNGKLTKQVQLPQYLDLTRFVSGTLRPRHPVRYRLVSMVTHMGQSANCGHYTAIALAADGYYYQFDDVSVRQISLSTVLNMSAYLVLYELERPFPHNHRTASAASETAATADSESASVGGGSEPKEGSTGSPPAGTPAPRTVSHPTAASLPGQRSATASLVPYESDLDSDGENKDTEVDTGRWKITPVIQRPSASLATCTTQWRVTDIQPQSRHSGQRETENHSAHCSRHSSTERSSGPPRSLPVEQKMNVPTNPVEPSEESDKALCDSIVREAERRRDTVADLLRNPQRGYGNNNVRTWNGTPSAMQREVENDRIESRKRSYEDVYNSELDRGKVKKKRFGFRRELNGRFNGFQQRANVQNGWRNNRHDYGKWGNNNNNNWGFRRNYNKHHNNYNKHYNNYSRY